MTKSHINNWYNRGDGIPYNDAINIAFITGISLNRLAPFNPTNNIIKLLNVKLLPFEIPIDNILLKNFDCLREIPEHRPIIIDTDGVLISGLIRYETYKASGYKSIPVNLFDLDSLVINETIENIDRFLISERFAIGLRLNQLAGNRQGQRNDLIKPQESNKKNVGEPLPLRSFLNEVRGRKDEQIIKLVGFNSIGTHHNVKQVYLHGNLDLRNALDNKQLSISNAAKIAKLPTDQQLASIQHNQLGEEICRKKK